MTFTIAQEADVPNAQELLLRNPQMYSWYSN